MMSALLKPERLKRYAEIGALLVKYGRSDLVEQSASALGESQPRKKSEGPRAEELADDLEKLGATFIKLGQEALVEHLPLAEGLHGQNSGAIAIHFVDRSLRSKWIISIVAAAASAPLEGARIEPPSRGRIW